nr:MAG TPA: hypothetical protein [Caudoviricetes sp.]
MRPIIATRKHKVSSINFPINFMLDWDFLRPI